jgi:hypothetical protein
VLAIAGLVRHPEGQVKRKPIPPGVSTREASYRLLSAAYEGLLHGIACWESDRHVNKLGNARLLAYLSHVAFWADQFSDAEAVRIRGDAYGLIRESAITDNTALGGDYWLARKAALAYARCLQEMGEIPTTADVLGVLGITGSSAKRAVSAVMQGSSYTVPIDLLDCNSLQTTASGITSSSYAPTPEDVDRIDALVAVRSHLMRALADDGHLTASVAEIVDLLYFGSLCLDGHDYADQDMSAQIRAIDAKLSLLDDDQQDRYKALVVDRDALLAWRTVTLPAVVTGYTTGMRRFPQPPITPEGGVDLNAIAHLTPRFQWRSRTHCVALHIALRRRIRQLSEPMPDNPWDLVTPFDYRMALDDVFNVKRMLRCAEYLDPLSPHAVQPIHELHLLLTDHYPVACCTMAGKSLFVRTRYGETVPMVSWVRDKFRRNNLPQTVGFPRFTAYPMLCWDYTQQTARAKFAASGECEIRPTLVKVSRRALGDVSITQSVENVCIGKGKTVKKDRHYKQTVHLLPRSNFIVGCLPLASCACPAPAPTAWGHSVLSDH